MQTIYTPSPNFDARTGPVRHLVLHYTGMQTGAAAVARLCNPEAKVSSHYVVDEDGAIYALVEEQCRAWHAGVSYWGGVEALNDSSVGIEIVNPGHEWGYRPFPEVQIAAALSLSQAIIHRHRIPARNVVGHSDIAPNRKQDPGELFPWKYFAESGVGLWTEETAESRDFAADLAAIGYDTSLALPDVITAFQRRFLPKNLSGTADALTAGRAAALARLTGGE